MEAAITPRTTGIVGVHLWGRACDVSALAAIASRRGLRLVYDAAHAFASTAGGRPIGVFGDCAVLSFHATKFFNTGEGGAVVTDDDALAERLRLMINFGFRDYDDVSALGINGKMSELSAALGLANLAAVDRFVEANRANHGAYAAGLTGIPGIALARYDPRERNNHQYVIIEVDAERFGLTRDQLHRVLHSENVLARCYFHPGVHRMAPYRDEDPDAAARLPATERLCGRVLALPTGTQIGTEGIARLCEVIARIHRRAEALRAAFGRG